MLDDAAFGAATSTVPSRISPSDPASRYTSAHGGQAQFCYATNYLIDVKNAVIVDVEASTAVRQAEVTAAKRMIERVQDNLGIWPRKLIGDTGYGPAEMLAWLVHERDIEPHIPVFDKSDRSMALSRAPTSPMTPGATPMPAPAASSSPASSAATAAGPTSRCGRLLPLPRQQD